MSRPAAVPFTFPEFEPPPLDEYQLRAALLDHAEFGFILVDYFVHARQVVEAAREAGMECRLREALGGPGWVVEQA